MNGDPNALGRCEHSETHSAFAKGTRSCVQHLYHTGAVLSTRQSRHGTSCWFTSLPVAAGGSLYGHDTKSGEGERVRAWRLNQIPKVLLFFSSTNQLSVWGNAGPAVLSGP